MPYQLHGTLDATARVATRRKIREGNVVRCIQRRVVPTTTIRCHSNTQQQQQQQQQ